MLLFNVVVVAALNGIAFQMFSHMFQIANPPRRTFFLSPIECAVIYVVCLSMGRVIYYCCTLNALDCLLVTMILFLGLNEAKNAFR